MGTETATSAGAATPSRDGQARRARATASTQTAESRLAEHELTALWLLGRVPQAVLPWPLLRAGRAGRGPGPDVREAVFVRDGVPLAGDVEVHLRASDFSRHGHGNDRSYDGVVLHLVWEDDRDGPVSLAGGGVAPAAAVGPVLRTPERLRARLRRGPRLAPPCSLVDGAADRAAESLRAQRITEAVRAEGRRRLAERVWRAARTAERHGWDRAWLLLVERALHTSAGRRRHAAPQQQQGPLNPLGGNEPWPLLEPLARDGRAGPLIEALRAPPLVPVRLGRGRAAEVGWNAALPLLAARAAAYDDLDLARGTAALASGWPAPRPYGRTRALASALTGSERTPGGGGALWAQGLLHTQELWCERGGCGACPFSGLRPFA